jgi:hypothetical protein
MLAAAGVYGRPVAGVKVLAQLLAFRAFSRLASPVMATSSFEAVLALSVLARVLDDFMTVPRSRRG